MARDYWVAQSEHAITYEGAGRRWPKGMPAKVQSQIEHELELIGDLKYAKSSLGPVT